MIVLETWLGVYSPEFLLWVSSAGGPMSAPRRLSPLIAGELPEIAVSRFGPTAAAWSVVTGLLQTQSMGNIVG